jgi:hypothetical protein
MLIDYVRVYQKSTQVINTQRKHAIFVSALFNSSRHNVKLYDIKGRFVGGFSGLSSLTEHNGVLFAKAGKSNIPQGVYIAAISNARHFVNEKVVVRK